MASTGKMPFLAPASMDMFAMHSRSSMDRAATPSPQYSRLWYRARPPDQADQVEDDILAADPGLEDAGQVDPDGLGDLEPGLPRGHAGGHVGGAHPGGKGPQGPIGAGVGVRADDTFPAAAGLFRRRACSASCIIEVVRSNCRAKVRHWRHCSAALMSLLGVKWSMTMEILLLSTTR